MEKKSLSKNTMFYLLYNVLNVIFPFISGMYVTRVLFPEDIGLIESVRNFVQYFVILAFLGIPTYGLREISKYRNEPEKLNKIYSELMIINFISTIIFVLIFLLLIFGIDELRINYILYLIIGISILLNVFNNSWLYEGLEEFKYISLRNLLFKCISFICLIIFVRDSNDINEYAVVTVVGTAGNYILNIINSRKFVKFTFKNLNLKQHLKSIAYLVVVNLAIEIYTLVDVTMLSFMKDKATVAYYSYAMKIYKILLHIVNTFTLVLVPRIAFYYKENKFNEFNELISKTLKVIFIITIPMIIGIIFTSKVLITLIYGSNYIRSASVLNILSIVLCLSPIGYLLGSRMLLVSNKENKMIIPVTIGAITNVICNSCLIPKYGEIGAAIASLFSEFIVMVIYVLLGKNVYNLLGMKKSVKNIIISSLVMLFYLVIVSNLKIDLIVITLIQIIGAIIIYFGFLFILNEAVVREYYLKIKIKGAQLWKKKAV